MTTSADQGSIADVGSPVLIAPAAVDAARPWGWQTAVIAVATAVLLLFNAHALDDWLGELSPNRLTQLLRRPVGGWVGTAKSVGLDTPRETLHARWEGVRRARFGREQPGEQGAAAGDE